MSRGAWRLTEDLRLMEAVKLYGNDSLSEGAWSKIAKYIGTRPVDSAIRRFEQIKGSNHNAQMAGLKEAIRK